MKQKFKNAKTSKSFTEQHEILGGEAIVYRTTQNGNYWQFRTWIREEKKYYRVSLKTRDLSTALAVAREKYFELQVQIRSNIKVFGITFGELVELYLAEQKERVETKRITKERLGTISSQLKHLVEFVGGSKIKLCEINKDKFIEYAQWRRLKNKSVRDITLRNEHAVINSLIKYAFRKKYLQYDYVDLEEIRIRGDNIIRRSTFTIEEYRLLYTMMRKYTNEKGLSESQQYYRYIIRDFILILSQCFARFGELRQVKWSNVQIEEDYKTGKKYCKIKIDGHTSKVRTTRTIICRGAEYFERIKTYSHFCKNDDFVFCDRAGNLINKKVYYKVWDEILSYCRLVDDRNLSYYCLRHFGITMRLYAGVSFEDLSTLAGTSYSNLRNHYSHVDISKLKQAALKDFIVDNQGFIIRKSEISNDKRDDYNSF
jgi:integrase